MSSLTIVEKKYFEDMFGMSSGYVLDFTNNTFATFFRETVGQDIYLKKYDFNGDSKAKRLRHSGKLNLTVLSGKYFQKCWRFGNTKAHRTVQTREICDTTNARTSFNDCSAKYIGKKTRTNDSWKRILETSLWIKFRLILVSFPFLKVDWRKPIGVFKATLHWQ